MKAQCLLLLSFVTLVFCIHGCGNSGGSSKGVVQFSDGEPVQSGSVEFRSLADGARYASRITSRGAFTLTDASGNARCPAGEYEVVVVQIVLTEDLAAEDHEHGRTVPRRYADYYTTGLRITKLENDESQLKVTLEPDDE